MARLSWNDHGQWSQITLFREGVSDNFPTTHLNSVENTIHYAVPQDKAGELIKFNPALSPDDVDNKYLARVTILKDGSVLAKDMRGSTLPDAWARTL